MRLDRSPARVLHVFTVPLSLRFVRGLPRYLRGRGYGMAVVTSPGEALERFGVQEDCPVFPVPMPRRITPLEDLQATARLIGAIRTFRPDIVHAQTPKGGLLGMLAARAAGVDHRIYHMRGLLVYTATGLRRQLFTSVEHVCCSLATRVLCVSHSLRNSAVELRLVEPSRIAVLGEGSGQGVDAEKEFRPDLVEPAARRALRESLGIEPDAPVVLFVGRLVRDKGIVELAEAWQEIRRLHPKARLLLVGPYEERDPVPKDVIQRLQSDPSIRHVKWAERPADYYAIASQVVLPTYREGFPNVPLEAAAMGLPVVATRIPGCVDAVSDGETGTLVPARDAVSLSRAIAAYLLDEELARRHGKAGRERVVRSFHRERIWSAMADVYDELLDGRGT